MADDKSTSDVTHVSDKEELHYINNC